MLRKQSAENLRKNCNQFCLRLRHAVVLISNVRTSASKKINLMALIRTLTILITAFERTKKIFCDFRQTEREKCNQISPVPCLSYLLGLVPRNHFKDVHLIIVVGLHVRLHMRFKVHLKVTQGICKKDLYPSLMYLYSKCPLFKER